MVLEFICVPWRNDAQVLGYICNTVCHLSSFPCIISFSCFWLPLGTKVTQNNREQSEYSHQTVLLLQTNSLRQTQPVKMLKEVRKADPQQRQVLQQHPSATELMGKRKLVLQWSFVHFWMWLHDCKETNQIVQAFLPVLCPALQWIPTPNNENCCHQLITPLLLAGDFHCFSTSHDDHLLSQGFGLDGQWV